MTLQSLEADFIDSKLNAWYLDPALMEYICSETTPTEMPLTTVSIWYVRKFCGDAVWVAVRKDTGIMAESVEFNEIAKYAAHLRNMKCRGQPIEVNSPGHNLSKLNLIGDAKNASK